MCDKNGQNVYEGDTLPPFHLYVIDMSWETTGRKQPLVFGDNSLSVRLMPAAGATSAKPFRFIEMVLGVQADDQGGVSPVDLNGRLSDAGSADPRILGAVRALDSLPLPNGWSPSDAALNTLLAILESRKEPPTRRRALRLLGKLEQKSVVGSTRFAIVLTKLCEQPDALLYRDLLALKTVLGLEIEVPKPPVATVEDVLARLDQANVDRGRELFFDRVGGAGCVSCHRVRGRGSDIAPDLSGVGVRLTPENMIKSIIQPSAAITEGYAVQFFVTDDGRTHTGAVIRETSTTVTILRTDSSQVSLATESIDSRKRLKQSVMPSGYDLFGAEQLANLTAWLLTLRDGFAIVSEQE